MSSNTRKVNIERLAEAVFCFTVFFAFLCPGFSFGTDIQPYALIFAVVVIFLNFRSRIPKSFVELSVLFLSVAMVVFFLSILLGASPFECVRSLLNYVSVSIIPIATFFYLQARNGLNELFIKICLLVWLAFALVQMFISKDIGSFLLADMRTSDSRGVNSLFNEPSFYGYSCIFALIIVQTFKRHRWIFTGILIVELVFFAASAVSAIYLVIGVVAVCCCQLTHVKIRTVVIIIVGFIVAVGFSWVLMTYFPDMRITRLMVTATTDFSALLTDQSISERLDAIYQSIYLFLSNGTLPSLFQGHRIMSGYGSFLVDFGVIGLVAIIGIFVILLKGFPVKGGFAFAVAVTVTAMMFSAVQLSSPLFSFVLGLCMWHISYSKPRKN